MTKRTFRSLLAAAAVLLLATMSASVASAATPVSHALIQGSGSSWSGNAIAQWVSDVHANGLQVVFTASGSAQGRKDFAYNTTDFAVSEIGYQGVDTATGASDTSNGRGYAYLPIVGGGTSFPYQLRVAGKLVTNLRLSGKTIAEIFTGHITNWADPAITKDNNGHAFPSIPIVPVVHSEGSGTSAHFTEWLDQDYASIWRPYYGRSGMTEYFPQKGNIVAQSGSDGVMNYVTSAAANGSIGVDEYSYALAKGYPVAKVENAAGYFTLPTQYNVAVALTQAKINMDKSSPNYLLQNLSGVFNYTDKRTYPLSSYSYAIIPTGAHDSRMTTAKRQTIEDFLYYAVCQGQGDIGPIGYSSLPVNLVSAGFSQLAKLKQADPGVVLTNRSVNSCQNPTFIAGHPSENHLAQIAPQPPLCDSVGNGPCSLASAADSNNLSSSGKGGSSAAGSGSQTTGAATTTKVDPLTGQPLAGSPTQQTSSASSALVATNMAGYRSDGATALLAPLAFALLLGILIGPPVLITYLRGRRQ